jgi:hypothetical protein
MSAGVTSWRLPHPPFGHSLPEGEGNHGCARFGGRLTIDVLKSEAGHPQGVPLQAVAGEERSLPDPPLEGERDLSAEDERS